MAAIVRAADREQWASKYGAQVTAVISNRPGAGGLEFARKRGIATAVLDHTTFNSREAFDGALATQVQAFEPALVVLAGFMRILSVTFVDRFKGRLLNIHPSLLPAFPGLNTHARAIQAGCRFAGASVHQVTSELDVGPILDQAIVPVLLGDTPQALAARVLTQEHILYPRAVRQFLGG